MIVTIMVLELKAPDEAEFSILWSLWPTAHGYETRRKVVAVLNVKDISIALLEDLVTSGLACFFVTR